MCRSTRWYRVDCRIGSLENGAERVFSSVIVDCRIGSLERTVQRALTVFAVDCRIGSLEIVLLYLDIEDLC